MRTTYGWLIPAFIALWVTAILLDWLPTIDERIRWQAYVTGTISVLRMTLVAAAGWFTGELRAILWALLAFVLVKLALLLYYVHRHHGLIGRSDLAVDVNCSTHLLNPTS